MKLFFLTSFLTAATTVFSQTDTAYLKSLYARCMDFSEEKADSINYYADWIAGESSKLHYEDGRLFSLRLHGLCEEYKSDYGKAIGYYLQALEEARKLKNKELEVSELTDLAIVYTAIKQFAEAKLVYLQSVELKDKDDINSLVDIYSNLGAIYNNLKQHDSALFFLQKGLRIGGSLQGKEAPDLSSIYNNLGNTYFFKKEYQPALYYFTINYNHHLSPGQRPDLWFDCLNIADVYIEMGAYDSATKYADSSMEIAGQLHSRSKQADGFSILSKLNQKKGNYKNAYTYLQKWYDLDTAMVNTEKTNTVAKLQEQFHARQRENEKLLLQAEVYKQIFRSRIIMVVAIALLLVTSLIAWAFIIKRNANRKLQATNVLIIQQNEKLAELNFEKNALISIVSHDLGTPFASIGMWGQLLQSSQDKLDDEQKKSVSKILEATRYGENLIRRILDVEKMQANQNKLSLESFDLNSFAVSMVESFRHLAGAKDIELRLNTPPGPVYLMSDRELISRVCENLLSNAVKFTPRGKKIMMNITDDKNAVVIQVKDEGVGIRKEELPWLFSKYSKISSQPTDGESSTGLGLAIVKRILDELNGEIFCDSEQGKGTIFTVVFKK